MAELKTQKHDGSVMAFLNGVENERKRTDSLKILELMEESLGEEGKMWGTSIVGFGDYRYRYESGREGEWFLAGFSPRKKNITLYIMAGFDEYGDLLSRLGKYKTGKSCLYINKLEDVDTDVLQQLIKKAAAHLIASNP